MKKKSFRLVLLILTGLLLSGNVEAQTTSFIYYGVEQGLSQSQVQCITQDDDGNLWIGTLSGLTRYNGREFSTYSRIDSLAEDWITTLYKDNQGNIWLGHWAGGVSMYNFKTKHIENLNLEEYTRFKTIKAIRQDEQNRYWIATEGAGVFVYDPANKKMVTLTKKDGLSSDNVYALSKDIKGNMWVGTDIGITVFNSKNTSEHSILNIGNGLHSNRITCIQPVHENELWIGSADAGIEVAVIGDDFSINAPGKAIQQGGELINEKNGLGSNFINCILEDNQHEIWIGTAGGGATKCIPFPGKNRTEAISKAILINYSTKQGLNYFNANAIFQDRENAVWIGTDIGLNEYRGERFQLYDESDSLSNNLVWTTLCDKDGNIWAGTNDGISKLSFNYSKTNNKQFHRIRNYTTRDGLPSNVVLSSFEDNDGNLWFGTGFGGVAKLNSSSGKFEVLNHNNGLADDVVFSIGQDKQGNMWFGTKEGVSKYNPQTKKFRNYTIADGLGGNNVYRIFRDHNGTMWFGALGGALSMFDGNTFKTFDEHDGIRHRFILSINEDHENNMWFGTYGGGIYKYDGKEFTNYTVKEGLTTDSPYSLIADSNNNLWIGNTRGLDKLDAKTKQFVHYGKADGFPGVETNPNAVCIDKQGNIWYGTIMGLVRYSPDEDKPNAVEPKTFISGMKLFMKDAPFPDDARFSYDENHLTFTFVGISLSVPGKVKYQYKLEGFDKDWLPEYTSNNEAVYTNLPPGSYTFMVRACNSDGICNITPTSYKFFIAPPFWQTAVFYVALSIFILFGLYVVDKIRTKNLKKAKKTLEDKVEERTVELAVKNSELAEKNKDITDSIRYAKRIQDAILPPNQFVKRLLPESFVYFKPKDIVSGDFYYVDQKGDDILFAAIDCTGHGVPGAFMSIVGHNILKQAIETTAPLDAGKLLDTLNIGVSTSLNQATEDTRLRDGMDVALCIFNRKKMELQFAGAYNPLFVARGEELIEVKGDNIAIGTYTAGNQVSYTNHRIPVMKGDVIYIFSDGYVDQFGGPDGKKLKMTQFKQILIGMHNKSVDAQYEQLERSIEEWRGVLQQVDDMLVIGVRI